MKSEAGRTTLRVLSASFHRLYPSTWLLMSVLTTAMTLIVVPGEIVYGEDLMGIMIVGDRTYSGVRAELESGWPWAFLKRHDDVFVPIRDPLGDIKWYWGYSWKLTRGRIEFRPLILGADLLLVAGIVAVSCWLWNRFRSRPRFWQMRLRSLLFTTACVAAALSWYLHIQRRYHRELEITAKYDEVFFTEFEPRWLYKLIGAKPFNALPGLGYRHVNHLMCVRYTDDSEVPVNPQDLRSFSELSELERLGFRNTDGATADDFALLSRLKRLSYLSVSTPVGAAALTKICAVSSLQFLAVNGDLLQDGDLPPLSNLQQLRELNLSLSKSALTGKGLQVLARMANLRQLSLRDCQFSAQYLDVLDSSAGLETVYLWKLADVAAAESFVNRHPAWRLERFTWDEHAIKLERGPRPE